ncbi:DUF6928 family protein [Ruegeria sp. SCP11]|uniref:DUF6928 family protein n=1 Tax=Ruegeria sp. SCP11 TaxID=3141378 RepID=UPI0033399BCE
MGAKAWFAAYYDENARDILAKNPQLDRDASRRLANQLLLDAKLEEVEDGSLDFLNPDEREVLVGDYGGIKIVAHQAFNIDCLSQLDARWRFPDLGSTIYVRAMHSVIDWGAFALWKNGDLVRALSVLPDGGVIEDVGPRMPFEAPFWDGTPALEGDDEEDDTYPLPFHPLEFSEAALLEHLGFQFEGYPNDWVCDPFEIPIMKFRASSKPFWKLW